MRAPWTEPAEVPDGDVAIVGMPIDTYATTVGQTGMRLGPRRIREASLFHSGYYGIQADVGLSDFTTGVIRAWPERFRLVDTGDAPVLPNDPAAQVAAAAAHVADASRTSGLTVTLGGDHFVAYPAALGVIKARVERQPDVRFGYLHIDSHTDFVDYHHQSGSFHHGSAARRVSEIEPVSKMAWFGVNAMTQPGQVQVMYDRGYRLATASHIDRVGPARAMEQVLDYLLDGVTALYVSIDIDVVNAADAPATSAAIFRGLTARALLEALHVLSRIDMLVGFDLCEVNPQVDSSGRTEMLAVEAILAITEDRLFDRVGSLPKEQLDQILFT